MHSWQKSFHSDVETGSDSNNGLGLFRQATHTTPKEHVVKKAFLKLT